MWDAIWQWYLHHWMLINYGAIVVAFAGPIVIAIFATPREQATPDDGPHWD